MPPRNPELPEGTDHIVNGAMDTGGGSGGATSGGGKIGGAPPTSGAGGASSGFIGSGDGDGTGGTASGSDGQGLVDQLRDQASSLRGQATDRVRDFAQSGKGRATDALDDLSKAVTETAETIDERLGEQYGDYARRAADAVSSFADTLRRKEVDELYEDVSSAVRKSPAVAVGVAAVVGFTLVRLIKSGFEGDRGSGGEAGSKGGGASGSSGGTGA